MALTGSIGCRGIVVTNDEARLEYHSVTTARVAGTRDRTRLGCLRFFTETMFYRGVTIYGHERPKLYIVHLLVT